MPESGPMPAPLRFTPPTAPRRSGQAAPRPAIRAASCFLAGLAAAATAPPPARADGWSGGVGLTSAKSFRGLNQSDGHPTALLDLHYRTDTGWSAGVGAASLSRSGGPTTVEITPGVSRVWQWDADWTAQLGGVHYGYTGPRTGRNVYDYDEASVSAGWRGRLSASLAWSPNTTGRRPDGTLRTDHALAGELTWHQPLAGRLAFDAGLGYYDLRAIRGAGYAYGSVGLGWGVGPANLYLAWIDSRAANNGLVPDRVGGPHWAATALWNF